METPDVLSILWVHFKKWSFNIWSVY